MNWIRSHKFEIVLFTLALLVRLGLFFVNFSHNEHDLIPTIKGDDGYYEISQGILQGYGFSGDLINPDHPPNPLRPPVWPYLIALCVKIFGTYWAAFIFELMLGCVIPILSMYVARYIVSEKISKIVGLGMVFEPYLILLSFIFYTETSFTFFFLISLLFFFRYIKNSTIRNAAWASVFMGIATLIKPTIQYLPILIPIALAIIWRKHLTKDHLKHLLVFFGIFAMLIAPWLYRNHKEFGVWGMSAQPAFNLYVYLVPTVLSIDNGTNFRTEYLSFVKKDNFDENSINLSNASFYKDEALKVIGDHKMALLKSMLVSEITFYTHDGMLNVLGYSGVRIENVVTKPAIFLLLHPKELISTISIYIKSPAIAIILMRLLWIAIAAFFFLGAILYAKREGWKTHALAAFFIVLYFSATTMINGLGVNARFRVPVLPFILAFAIYGFLVTWYGIKNRFSHGKAFDSNPRI